MLIIGMAGGTGSGKTTVVNTLVQQLKSDDIIVISQDNYYKDNSNLSFQEREKLNYDHPNSIDFDLLIHQLTELKNNKSIEQPLYSFHTHSRKEDTQTLHPNKVIIVEGILVLTQPKLRDLFDIKVFVNADSDERLIRRIRRDINERGRSLEEVLNRYQTTLKPMHEQFIAPSMSFADIIIPNMRTNHVAIDILSNIVQNYT